MAAAPRQRTGVRERRGIERVELAVHRLRAAALRLGKGPQPEELRRQAALAHARQIGRAPNTQLFGSGTASAASQGRSPSSSSASACRHAGRWRRPRRATHALRRSRPSRPGTLASSVERVSETHRLPAKGGRVTFASVVTSPSAQARLERAASLAREAARATKSCSSSAAASTARSRSSPAPTPRPTAHRSVGSGSRSTPSRSSSRPWARAR